MSRSRSPSRDRSRSRSPRDRRMRPERSSYRDAPYRRGEREPRRAFRSFFSKTITTSWKIPYLFMSLICNFLVLADLEGGNAATVLANLLMAWACCSTSLVSSLRCFRIGYLFVHNCFFDWIDSVWFVFSSTVCLHAYLWILIIKFSWSFRNHLFSQTNLCNNCKRPGHFARDCPNVSVCNNCGLPGYTHLLPNFIILYMPICLCRSSYGLYNVIYRHIAAECTAESRCWNCREPGHVAGNCSNEGICHSCGKTGHRARDCTNPVSRAGDLRLCNNCFKPGHLAADCTNDKACKNCRTSGHIARDCQNDPVCNICSISGHVARNCPKGDSSYSDRDRGSRVRGGGMQRDGFGRMGRDGGMQRDGLSRGGRDGGGGGVGAMIICHNCGGRGHMAYECPSARIADRGSRRYWSTSLFLALCLVIL